MEVLEEEEINVRKNKFKILKKFEIENQKLFEIQEIRREQEKIRKNIERDVRQKWIKFIKKNQFIVCLLKII